MAPAIIEVFELINYINGGSRPFEEGSRILNSNHILLCGSCNTLNTEIDKYFALCLKTSSLTTYPHEINVEIKINNNKKEIRAHCRCQAGNSGCCKHIVGVLLFLNKNTKDTIEQLGCTDLRQQWGQIKQKVSDAYAAEPFYKFCHGLQVEMEYTKSPEVKKEIFKILCESDVESELGQHTRCYRSSATGDYTKTDEFQKRELKNLEGSNDVRNNKAPVICNLTAIYGISRSVGSCDINELLKFTETNIWATCLSHFNLKISNREEAMFYNRNVCVTTE